MSITPPIPLRDPTPLDGGIGQDIPSSTNAPPDVGASASPVLADETSEQRHAVRTDFWDSFACYTRLMDTSMPSAGVEPNLAHNPIERQARAVPYHPAVRLPDRPNGAPLATIIEQCSRSTLNSYASHLRSGQTIVGRSTDSSQGVCPSHNVSHDQGDENVQCLGPDRSLQVQDMCTAYEAVYDHVVDVAASPTSNALHGTAVLEGLFLHQHTPTSRAHTGVTDCDMKDRSVNSRFDEILRTTRRYSQPQSQFSPMACPPNDLGFEHKAGVTKNQPHAATTIQAPRDHFVALDLGQASPSITMDAPSSDSQAGYRKVSITAHEASARAILTSPDAPWPEMKSETDFDSVLHPLPPSVATRSCERPTFVQPVLPEPRDVAQIDGVPGPSTLSLERRHDISAGTTFDGVLVPCCNAPSLAEYNRARESSRDASFCSTASTSYSGTVLGVDVDIKHKISRLVQHSPSVTPPAWFTPQRVGVDRQMLFSFGPGSEPAPRLRPHSRSMISSALTALLPIAAASGIVRSNYSTPKISFYSPSGNLIQPEDCSPPRRSTSDFTGRPNVVSSACNKEIQLATCNLERARPCRTPQTLLTTSAALPSQYRYQQQLHKKQHNDLYGSTIVSASKVRGCGGVVRTEQLSLKRPRSMQGTDASQHDKLYLIRSMTREMKRKILGCVFYFSKSRQQERTDPRTTTHSQTSVTTVVSDPIQFSDEKKGSSGAKQTNHVDKYGPLIGKTLRRCFCQPYDGAERDVRTLSSDSTKKMDALSTLQGRVIEPDADLYLPIARVIDNNSSRMGGKSGKSIPSLARVKRDSAVSLQPRHCSLP